MEKPVRKVGYKSPPINDPERYWKLSPSDLAVLYHLTDLVSKTESRTAQVYVYEIAQATGMSKRRVSACLAKLKDLDYITSTRMKVEHGGNAASTYTVLNPDADRQARIRQAATLSGIPLERMIDYVYWIHFHRKKLLAILYPTVADISMLAKCPWSEAKKLVQGLVGAGILVNEREIRL